MIRALFTNIRNQPACSNQAGFLHRSSMKGKPIKCLSCHKIFIPTSYHHFYCGNKQTKGSCSRQNEIAKKVTRKLKNVAKYRYYDYKHSAKDRNIKFDLSFEDMMKFWQKPCHYCGCQMRGIGLDRVDNKIGYVITNLLPCCGYCNYIKGFVENKSHQIGKKRIIKSLLAIIKII
jgi:hypothetical protein